MARRVFLHIGTMKAATTYLQHLFDANRELLAGHGILWQGSRFNQDAIHDFQGSPMRIPSAKGAWPRLRDEIRRTSGDALVSMELMARMSQQRAGQLVEALQCDEVDVILTARDLSRVAPSHWQETTQNMGTAPWREWIESVVTLDPAVRDLEPPFWRHHYLPGIVQSWSPATTGRLYLVTIPGAGGDSAAVWRRFASVIGVPAEQATEPRFNNASLGGHSAELMRRLNIAIGDVPFPQYRWGFKAALAKQTLSRRSGDEPRPGLTAEQHARLRGIALDMVEQIGRADITVVGDLEELVPGEEPAGEPYDPGRATDSELLEAAMAGLLGVGRKVSKLHVEREDLRAEVDRLRRNRLALPDVERLKDRLPDGVRTRLRRVKWGARP
jgi:hypothetical protein